MSKVCFFNIPMALNNHESKWTELCLLTLILRKGCCEAILGGNRSRRKLFCLFFDSCLAHFQNGLERLLHDLKQNSSNFHLHRCFFRGKICLIHKHLNQCALSAKHQKEFPFSSHSKGYLQFKVIFIGCPFNLRGRSTYQ